MAWFSWQFCQSDSLRSIFSSPLCNPLLLTSHEVKGQSLPLCDAAPQTQKIWTPSGRRLCLHLTKFFGSRLILSVTSCSYWMWCFLQKGYHRGSRSGSWSGKWAVLAHLTAPTSQPCWSQCCCGYLLFQTKGYLPLCLVGTKKCKTLSSTRQTANPRL